MVTGTVGPDNESRTIRVSGVAYYKIVELAGLMSTLFGQQISISTMAEIMVKTAYDSTYVEAAKAVGNPQTIRQIREAIKKQALEFSDLLRPDYWENQHKK